MNHLFYRITNPFGDISNNILNKMVKILNNFSFFDAIPVDALPEYTIPDFNNIKKGNALIAEIDDLLSIARMRHPDIKRCELLLFLNGEDPEYIQQQLDWIKNEKL